MESATDVHSGPYPRLEQVTGTRWVGVKFLESLSTGCGGAHPEAMRFCEAICQVGGGHIDLSPEIICCEGAKRAFGWMKDKDNAVALKLSERIGMNPDGVRGLLKQVPVLEYPCAGIRVGDCTSPDVLVTYARPEAAMRLVRLWETTTGYGLHVHISSIMAVCGNAVVRAYMSQSISISFGCPDSRRYGGIQPEEMVIAVPAELLNRFAGIGNRDSASPSQ
jgi:uncharacterized protein (DUF169 family)